MLRLRRRVIRCLAISGAVFLLESFGKGLAAAVGAEMRSVRQGEGYGSLTAWNVKSALKIRVSHKVEAATMLTIPVKKAWMVAKNDFLFGLRYRFSSVFSLCAEAGLYNGETPFRFYLRYHAAKKVIIYGGAGGRPFRMAFGCNLHWRNWQILTGAAYQPVTILDLNAGDVGVILSSVLLTPIQAQALLKHRERYGRLLDIGELQVVEGFDTSTIRRLRPTPRCNSPVLDERFHPSELLAAARHYYFVCEGICMIRKAFRSDGTFVFIPVMRIKFICGIK